MAAIFAHLDGELPARHLAGIDPDSTVQAARLAVSAAFNDLPEAGLRLSFAGAEMGDLAARLGDYDVPGDAIVFVQRAS